MATNDSKLSSTLAPMPMALDDFQAGGGIFPPGRYRILESIFTPWDYDKKGPEVLAMRLTAQNLDDEAMAPCVQYYSLGQRSLSLCAPHPDDDHRMVRLPAEDGKPTEGKLAMNSNFNQFLRHACKSGFVQATWDAAQSLAVFEGVEASFHQITLKTIDTTPSATSMVDPETAAAAKAALDKFAKTLPVICGDVVMPSVKAAKVSSIKSKANGKAPAPEFPEEVMEVLIADLTEVLAALPLTDTGDPSSIGRSSARIKVFNAHKKVRLDKTLSDQVVAAILDDAALTTALSRIDVAGVQYTLAGTDLRPE